MNPITALLAASGEWRGPSRLWLTPDLPAEECESRARLSSSANGRFALFQYDWTQDGNPQEGALLAGFDPNTGVASIYWVDSWHMGNSALTCTGGATEGGVDTRGHYAAPTGPDWGWRIALEFDGQSLRLTMYNTPPDSDDLLAVEAVYTRSA